MTRTPSESTHSGATTGVDIIGDVHGQYLAVKRLLEGMGYEPHNGTWAHPERQAVFVGDLIDKGPDPAGVLGLVRGMVDANAARLVVGNHELNWISACWQEMDDPEAFLAGTRKHSCRRRMSRAVDGDAGWLMDMLGWLQRQPILIDEPGLRVVHASWHGPSVDVLRAAAIDCLDSTAMAHYQKRYSPVHLALDRLVAGAEHRFDRKLVDTGYGSLRRRVHWWPGGAVPVHPAELAPSLASDPGYPDSDPPVFFGHYALTGPPRPLARNVAGVDFGAAYGGPLVAYRHQGSTPLCRTRFVECASVSSN